jgi:hypothetical protein
MFTESPSADWLADHRRVWAKKRPLRMVYGRWFRLLRAHCAPGSPDVELGCGPGLFKEVHPRLVATDTGQNPYADLFADGGFQPFGLLPAALVGAVEALDRVVSLVPRLTASRCLTAIERLPGEPPRAAVPVPHRARAVRE